MAEAHQYSSSELLTMQQDAIRRVKQMQERARMSVNSSSPAQPAPVIAPPPIHQNRPPERQKQTPSPIVKEPPHTTTQRGFSLNKLFPSLNLDSDKLILLAILFLLYNEGADYKLLLAICYIML